MIIFPNRPSTESTRLLQRIKISFSENRPRLCEASRNTDRNVSTPPSCSSSHFSTASATNRLSSHPFGSGGRLLVLFLCLCNSHLSWGLTNCCICYFCCHNLSHFCCYGSCRYYISL